MIAISPTCRHDLGWEHVQRALAGHCATELARREALALGALPDAEAVRQTLAGVAQLSALADRDASPPLDGVHAIASTVARCRRGGVAPAEDLVRVAATARAIHRVRRHLQHHRDSIPALAGLTDGLPDVGTLASELESTFDEAGRVRDDASPELRAARRRVATLHQAIKARLDDYLRRPEVTEVCQDLFYTQREDRYVLPIIASFQAQVPGIIHGTSHTEQTVFVEPEPFIAANNEIKLAEAAAEAEEARVLADRSAWVAEEAEALEAGVAGLVALDLWMARALLGRRLDAAVPEVATGGRLDLRHARNPLLLLRGADVVPNDILLDEADAFVIITGPNTGGKTVTLNTVGLVVLMVHAGLPVPADPESRVVLFERLDAIIGDPQDIQRDLSTFSGHIEALNEVLAGAAPGSLVLLDELIVGTEPERGAALAIATLEALVARGARGFVTTHYERLKTLAYEDPRFANAAVGIDPRTLRPTYALHRGEPGSSSPFEIAERLGFDGAILARARAISVGHGGLADALARLDEARAQAEAAAEAAREAERRAEAEAERLQRERRRLETRAADEIAALQQRARKAVDEALAALREQVREVQRVNDPRELEQRRRRVREIEAELTAPPEGAAPVEAPAPPSPPAPRKAPARPAEPHDAGDLAAPPAVGDTVWARPLRKPGTVLERRGARFVVGVGSLHITLEAGQLGRVGGLPAPAAPSPPSPPAGGRRDAPRDVDVRDQAAPMRTSHNAVDLRGLRGDEVEGELSPFLDRAFRALEDAVWVIHGIGTGVVRDEARAVLARAPYVAAWRPGWPEEGGDGVSIAWLERP